MDSVKEGDEPKRDPRAALSAAFKEVGHPASLTPTVQNELEQVVESILQIGDKEEQSEIIINIINVIQLIISNQQEQFNSYPFPSPEILERYKNVDKSVFDKIINLTEKTVEQDLALEVQESKIKLQQTEHQLENDEKKLQAEIEIGRNQIDLDKHKSIAELEIIAKKLDHDIQSRNRGQIFAFIFALLSLGVGITAIFQGSAVGGSILSVLGVATTIITQFLRPSELPFTIKGKRERDSKPLP